MNKKHWIIGLNLLVVMIYACGCSLLDPSTDHTTSTFTTSTSTTFITYNLAAQQNTFSYSVNPGTIHNTSEVCWVGWNEIGTMESYIQFDLSTLPSTAEIHNASLKLYIDADTLYGIRVYFYNINTTWEEQTLNWQNRPFRSGTAVASKEISVFETDSWINVDLTECVKQWITGEAVNNGLVIQSHNFKDWNQVSYSSKASSSNQPQLEIAILN